MRLLPIPIMRTKERGAMNRYICAAVFCTFVTLAHATDVLKRFGSWAVIRASDGVDLIAITVNEAGSSVGFRCFATSQECIHVLSANIICKDGDTQPVLINSDHSALSMNAVCSINGNNHELLLTNYDVIHEILKKGSHVGFAMPMESGQFKVVRFSLDGSGTAMDFVEEATSRLKRGDSYL